MQAKSVRNVTLLLFFWFSAASAFAENSPRFTENKGQHPSQVEFNLRVANSDIYFEKDRLVFSVYNPEVMDRHNHDETHTHEAEDFGHAYHVNFLGASNDVVVESAGNRYPDYSNYIKGEFSASHVNAFDKLVYRAIYPGIDIEYFGKEGNLKYDVKIAAGADPSVLKMQYEGASSVALKNGNLIVSNVFNSVEESIPLAYQFINGIQQKVECRYVLSGTTVSFEFPNGYDENEELVIDPTLVFSSYTGSTANNFGFTATYDDAGALYGGGIAFGAGYPTVIGSYSTAFNGGTIDMAISKFAADGTTLIYSTYLGGDNTEAPHSMIINSQGQLVILGTTSSSNYPTSTAAYDNTFNGGTAVNYVSNGTDFQNGSDIVVSVLSADGSSLVGSTFLGGSDNDGLNDNATLSYNYGDIFRGEVVVDDADNIYITSSTVSNDFPTTVGSIDQTLGGSQDAICAKFNSNVSVLEWSTYLGGDGADAGYSLKLNAAGDVYFVGGTEGQSFPIAGNTLHTTYQGGSVDGYITHISNDGSILIGSSYIGTSSYDQTYFVEVDGNDDVYLYGQSEGNYPVTAGVYSNANGKQFIQKLSPDLTTSIYSTVFGSGSAEVNISPTAFLVDVCQRVFISGWGGGTNNGWNSATGNTNGMATTPNGYQLTTDGSDFYFMVLDSDAGSLLYGSFFGGNGIQEHVDGGTSRFNDNAVIYQAVCAGCGGSSAFPTTPGVVSNVNGSSCNLGVIKLDLEIPDVIVEVSSVSEIQGCVPFEVDFTAGQIIATDFIWYFDDGDSSLLLNPSHTYTTPGTFEVLLIGTNSYCIGDEFTDTAVVTITAFLSTDVADAGPDQLICSGESAQLSATGGVDFSWTPASSLSNSNIFNPVATPSATTEYIVQAINADGCAAFDTVVIEVAQTQFAVSNDMTICFGDTTQLSASGGTVYSWTPNIEISNAAIANPLVSPSTTRPYVVEIEDANGCVGTDTVLLTVQSLPVANAGPDQSICEGEEAQLAASGGINYSWLPVMGLSNPNISNPVATPAATTDYQVIVSDNLGCSRSDTVTVTVNPLPVVDAGVDQTLCTGQIVQLNASGALTYQWSPAAGLSNPAVFNPISSPTQPTLYTVQGTDANGCSNADDVFVDVFTIEATAAVSICREDSTQLGVIGGASWTWVPNTGLSNPNAQNPLASPYNTTVYTVIADNGAGCLATDSILVSVNPLPIANAGPNHEICIGESIVLQGSGGTNYQWSPAIDLDNPNAQLPVSTPSNTITYALTVTDSNSCEDTDEVTVVVNPLPIVDAGQDSMICQNETLVLQTTGADSYTWSPLVGLSNPQSANPEATPQQATTYFVTGTDVNGCVNVDSVNITIFGVAANSGDYIICLGDSVQANVVGGAGYNWSPTNGVSDTTSSNPILSPEISTNYTVSVTSAFGCSAQTDVNVQVLTLPIAGFEAAFEPSCDGIFASFDNLSANGESYNWNFGDGTTSSETEPTHTYEVGPGNTITLVAYNNDSLCVDSITVDYSGQWFSNDSITVEYANIFTPNHDGINDCFKPEVDGRFSDCYEFKVYNRWGELLFEAVAGQNHCWDGRTKGGIMVPEGTYYYISDVRGINHAGYVTVVYQ